MLENKQEISKMKEPQMNKLIPKVGALIVTLTVFLFALFIIVDFSFGSYFVCIFLSIGYIIMVSGFQYESNEEQKVSANLGMIFSSIYAVLINLVYYAQITTVRLEKLNEQAVRVLDYRKGGLFFNYDLLGYGMMALSTFFVSLSIKVENKSDKWLKYLMMLHGIFFISCFIMPMLGIFTNMSDGSGSKGGAIALLIWCIYFFPIGILAFKHFNKK